MENRGRGCKVGHRESKRKEATTGAQVRDEQLKQGGTQSSHPARASAERGLAMVFGYTDVSGRGRLVKSDLPGVTPEQKLRGRWLTG